MKSASNKQLVHNYRRSIKQVRILNWKELLLAVCLIAGFFPLTAQPSGGPYGPIPERYDIPKNAGKIFYVSPDGQTGNKGDFPDKPTTIENAIDQAGTGDVIILRGGTYRTGNLIFNQGITLQPYADEQPVLKGTYVAKEWKNLGNGLWVTPWTHLFPSRPDNWWRRETEGKMTPLHRFNNDMVFVNGKFLQSAGWQGEVNENTFYIDYEAGKVYIGVNPANKMIEITAFDIALHRVTGDIQGKNNDHKGPIIRGITFMQYAYRAIEIEGTNPEGLSAESQHGKEVVGTTLENCTISFCSRVAAYLRGDKLTIRHCKISDTSTEGIYILSSSDVLLEKNIFMRNNIEMITGYYPAAVKIFNQCYRVTCMDNLITDLPFSNGIWYDVGNVDGRFINNWVEGVGNMKGSMRRDQLWPSQNGFFFEISKGAICAGNVFVNCDHGLMVLNSSNVQIYQNTFVNSIACIGRNGRTARGDHFGWHPSTGPDLDKREGHVFVNNLLAGENNFQRPLLFVWQPDSMSKLLTKPQLKQLDYNIYVRNSDKDSIPLIIWSPSVKDNLQVQFNSLDELHKMYSDFSSHSQYVIMEYHSIFKSPELKNFHLMPTFTEAKNASSVPQEISKLVGSSGKEKYVGAYP